MAHFVMQNLERSFAKLETQTYKETCVFPQFNYVRKTLEQLNYILMEGPYSLHSRLSQVYTAPAALSQVCSTKWFKFLVQNGSAVYIIDSKKNILAP